MKHTYIYIYIASIVQQSADIIPKDVTEVTTCKRLFCFASLPSINVNFFFKLKFLFFFLNSLAMLFSDSGHLSIPPFGFRKTADAPADSPEDPTRTYSHFGLNC